VPPRSDATGYTWWSDDNDDHNLTNVAMDKYMSTSSVSIDGRSFEIPGFHCLLFGVD
jgi:hypothetical protein